MRGQAEGVLDGGKVVATPAEDWKNTILAGLANYIDAGSIVSGSAALALWAAAYDLSPTFIGLLGAFSANAISAGVGALIGGRLCDLFGRKKIYQYDMLFYAFGMLWLVFAVQPWMIVVGFILVGLAVGADIPASWSLIAELAPSGKRGKHSGVAQVLWCLGPVAVLAMFLVLAPLGVLRARIVFAHLAIVAVVLTLLRSRMKESAVWEDARAQRERDPGAGQSGVGVLSAILQIDAVPTRDVWHLESAGGHQPTRRLNPDPELSREFRPAAGRWLGPLRRR